jgi:hypothetical protein
MSEQDKLLAFGSWLSIRKLHVAQELFSVCLNTKLPPSALRIKAGHLEALQHVLDAFTELYNGDLNKFTAQYLGGTPEEEEEKESKDE